MKNFDFVVAGGGVIGLSMARELRRRLNASVLVLEKEKAVARHGSGRNSGVLHAGFYYTADSLKARFTVEGNRRLHEFCQVVGFYCLRELRQSMDMLLERGRMNGVKLESISANEARRIEQKAKTFERAIFSPATSSANPTTVTEEMEKAAMDEGVVVRLGSAVVASAVERQSGSDGGVSIAVVEDGQRGKAKETVSCGHFVNASGLYADVIAKKMDFGLQYAILPFKGIYLYADPSFKLNCHVYPVPNLANPFLGVHFTVTSEGAVKIGPSAIPAFWREQYKGFDNFSWKEFFDIISRESSLFLKAGFDFRALAMEELRKYRKSYFVKHAVELVDGISSLPLSTWKWGKPGIRAQLVNTSTHKLEMDFVIEGDSRSTHILNAVSPGWTCSLPFADYVVDRIESATNKPPT